MNPRSSPVLGVAHVMSSIATEAAGPSYSVPALCDALALQQARVELHVVEAGPIARYADVAYHLHIHRRSRVLKPVAGSPAMRRALAAGAGELDIFHSHGLWRMPGLYAASSARRRGKPLVIAPRGMLEPSALQFSRRQKQIFWALGQGRALLGADCLHATSETELESIRKLGLTNPVAVVPNGVHIPEQRRERRNGLPRTLLYLGRIHPIKALERLVQAWSQVENRHPNWVLRLVGPSEGGYGSRLRAQCAQLGVQRVSFGDAAFGAAKQAEFEAAQLFVLPSHSENFGMTVAEAFAHELPVLASRGTPWAAIETAACGSWVDNSAASLATALDRLLALPAAELEAMGRRGRAWMERDFSWAQKAAQLLEVYAWLLGRTQKPPELVETVNGSPVLGNRCLGARRAPW